MRMIYPDSTLLGSDWIKVGTWDLPGVTDLKSYMVWRALPMGDVEGLRTALRRDEGLPFWVPAPLTLKREAQAFLETGIVVEKSKKEPAEPFADPDEVDPFWETPDGKEMWRKLFGDNVKKYSPDQPRDSHGRFGSGGTQEKTRLRARANAPEYLDTIARRANKFFDTPGNHIEVLTNNQEDRTQMKKIARDFQNGVREMVQNGGWDMEDKPGYARGQNLELGMKYIGWAAIGMSVGAPGLGVQPEDTGFRHNVILAKDAHDNVVAALGYEVVTNNKTGLSGNALDENPEYIKVGYLGSTFSEPGAATAIQYELASRAAALDVGVQSEATDRSLDYHLSIGRDVDQYLDSRWTAEQCYEIADLGNAKKALVDALYKEAREVLESEIALVQREIINLLKYDPSEPRDSRGRWTTGDSGEPKHDADHFTADVLDKIEQRAWPQGEPEGDVNVLSGGISDSLLREVMREQGFLGKPTLIPEKDWEKFVQENVQENGGKVLYRGISADGLIAGSGSKEEAMVRRYNNFLNAETPFIGRGVNGNGIYTTESIVLAQGYLKQSGNSLDDKSGGTVPGRMYQMVLDPNAKVFNQIRDTDVMKEYESQYNKDGAFKPLVDKDGTFPDAAYDTTSMLSVWAVTKGYDAMVDESGSTIVLNRGALNIRDNNGAYDRNAKGY